NNVFPSSTNVPLFASIFLPTSSKRSLVFIIIKRGDNFFPVILAGQAEVQRPHSVQEYAFNNCTQFKSCTSAAPNFEGTAFSSGAGAANGSALGSIINFTSLVTDSKLSNFPNGVISAKYVFGNAKIMCKCLE